MDAERVLAFRLARSGLAARSARTFADAAACPASDFARDAALTALAARLDGVSRDGYLAAIAGGELVVAHAVRGAIHALAPPDHALWGRALLGGDDRELAAQVGRDVRVSPGAALREVADATHAALDRRGALGKDELHAELRAAVRPELLPWCRGCESHHVAPMLWRYATIAAGARLDDSRRYVLGPAVPVPPAAEAMRRFLRFYAPAGHGDFAAWAGISPPHAKRVLRETDGIAEVDGGAWALAGDAAELEAPPAARGVRLLPPGDPYLQRPNRALLAPDPALRKRMFRPVASPGAVLHDGRLAGLWRAGAQNGRLVIVVESLGPVARDGLEAEAERVAVARGVPGARVDYA